MVDYITWQSNLQKKLKQDDTLAGDYPKILRKALKSLNKLLLKGEEENLYPFNPKLLEPNETPIDKDLLITGYRENFKQAYVQFFRELYLNHQNVFTVLNEEPSFSSASTRSAHQDCDHELSNVGGRTSFRAMLVR